MTTLRYEEDDGEDLTIDLRDHRLAALFAWLWPGAGHFYQRRFAKGFLFMICVLGTFLFGLRMGEGRVVYASSHRQDFRWQYFCQVMVGLPAFPALIQSIATQNDGDPLWTLCERFPEHAYVDGQLVEFQRLPKGKTISDFDVEIIDDSREFSNRTVRVTQGIRSLKDGFMARPAGPVRDTNDVLGMWHSELGSWFDIGIFYTVIAGLLNLLAIYDAFAGPVIIRTRPASFGEGE